jgi:hypothetical protein
MANIIIGTSRLGWDLDKKKLEKYVSVINHQLKNNKDLHISLSYNYSLDYISKCKNLSKSKSTFYIKAQFNSMDQFLLEIFYVSKMIGSSKKINIQINEFFDIRKFKDLNKAIAIIRSNLNLKDVYLTIFPNNYKKISRIYKTNKINFAIHYSLIENYFDYNFFKYCKLNNKKILVLRGLGGGINNFIYRDFYEDQKKINMRSNSAKFNKELEKNNISKLQARAFFIFTNRYINNIVISTSSINHLKKLEILKDSNISKSKINLLHKISELYFTTFKQKNLSLYKNDLVKMSNIKILNETYIDLKSLYCIKNTTLVDIFKLKVLILANIIIHKLKMKLINLRFETKKTLVQII